MTKILTSHEANGNDSKILVFNCAFTNEEDYNYVYILCNNNAIVHKFRTWTDEELKSAVKVLENKLYLLNPSLKITPK